MNLESIIKLLPPDILGQVASSIGEPEGNVAKGINGGIGAILASLLAQVGNPGRLGEIVSSIAGKNFDIGSLLPAISGLASGGNAVPGANSAVGQGLLENLFGASKSEVARSVASSAGLRPENGEAVMALAAPAAISALQPALSDPNGAVAGVIAWLNSNKASILSFIPAGLMSTIGLQHLLPKVDIPTIDPGAVARAAAAPIQKSSTGWVVPAALGVLALGAIWWYTNSGNMMTGAVADSGVKLNPPPTPHLPEVNLPKMPEVALHLPDTPDLHVPDGGLESRVVAFIQDPGKPVDRNTWFEFDRLNFDTAKTTLTPESQPQLENVVLILKAFPKVHLKVGGYTDNVGKPEDNLKLSDERAHSVMNELVAKGIDPGRLEAEGYGEQHPIGDNSTEEGRSKNRRIAVCVTEK